MYLYKEVHKTSEKMKETGGALLVEVIYSEFSVLAGTARQMIHIWEDVCIPETVSVHCRTWEVQVQMTEKTEVSS